MKCKSVISLQILNNNYVGDVQMSGLCWQEDA